MSRTTHEPVIVVYFCVGWMADGLVNKHQTDDPTYRGDQGTANKDGRPDLGCEICWQVSDSWAYATNCKSQKGEARKLQYWQYIACLVGERIPEEQYFHSIASKYFSFANVLLARTSRSSSGTLAKCASAPTRVRFPSGATRVSQTEQVVCVCGCVREFAR